MKKYLLPVIVLIVLYLFFTRKANAATPEGTVRTPDGTSNILPALPNYTAAYPGDSPSRNFAADTWKPEVPPPALVPDSGGWKFISSIFKTP